MNSRDSFSRNIRWLSGATVLVKPVWFLFLLWSARVLGPEEFGKYMFAISFTAVVAVVFEGGINIHTMRSISSGGVNFPIFGSHTIFAKAILGLVGAGTAIAGALLVRMPFEMIVLVLGASAYNVFSTMMIHLRFFFRASEVFKYEALSMIVEKFTVVVLCGLALIVAPLAQLFMGAFALSYLVVALFTMTVVLRKIGSPNWRIDRKYLWDNVFRPALPYALMNLFIIVYLRSGTLMLGALTGKDEVVGYFNAGYRILEAFILFPAMIVDPMYPVLARSIDDKEVVNDLVGRAAKVILAISILISCAILFFHEEFTSLFFGPGYLEAAEGIGVFGLAIIPLGMNWLFGTLVAASGRQAKANVIILLITCLNLALHYLLIPVMGLMGAVVTTVSTEFLIVFCNWWIVRDYVGAREMIALLIRAFSAAAVVGMAKAAGVLPGTFWVQLPLVIVGMCIAFFLFRLVSVQELRKLFNG